MFHVLTVHWHDDRWIEPQLRRVARHIGGARVYATLNGIAREYHAKFFHADEEEGTHAAKLNRLAEVARRHAEPDDFLVFLDGDAFPIAPITPDLLGGTPLAAVRRDENLGQRQPHPCFCVTTVRFWFEIGGDWSAGYEWTASNGQRTTDTGGELLRILDERGIAWRPLLRSNTVDLDPLWFGVYGDVVYHHGAGFRPPVTFRVTAPSRDRLRVATAAARIPASVPLLGRAERALRYRIAHRAEQRAMTRYLAASEERSDEVYRWICDDDHFHLRFVDSDRLVP